MYPQEQNNTFIIKPVYLILLFATLQFLNTFLSLTSGFSYDEAIWHYIGRNWLRHGLIPYSGGVDNKSPLIYILYGISDFMFGVNPWCSRLIAIACQSLGIFFVYRITVNRAGKQAGTIAIIIYGFSLLWRSTGGKMVSLTQAYEVTCLVIAFYFYLIAQNKRHLFFSGVMAGLAFAFRFTAGFSLLIVPLLLLKRKSFSGLILFLSGSLSTLFILLGSFLLMGIHINEFFIYSFSDNFVPGSVTDHSLAWKLEQFSSAFFYSELILFYPFIIIYLLIKKKIDIFILWFITSFIGIAVIGMFARTHLKELLPSASIITALSINYLLTAYKFSVRGALIVLVVTFFPKTFEPLFGAKKLLVHANKKHTSECDQSYWEDEDLKKQMGLWIKQNTSESDKVFVAGGSAQVQIYSERLSPSIYFFETKTPLAKEGLFSDLSVYKPPMLVVPAFSKYLTSSDFGIRSFVNGLTTNYYYLDTCLYGYRVYRKR